MPSYGGHCIKKPYSSEALAQREVDRMRNAPKDPRRRARAEVLVREPYLCACGMWHITYPSRNGHPNTRVAVMNPYG